MAYFLKINHRPKGDYLLIVDSFRDKERKQTVHKTFKALGYVNELVSNGISDPVAHFKLEVDKLNQDRNEQTKVIKTKKIGEVSSQKNVGYFLLKSMFDKLNVDFIIDLMCRNYPYNFNISTLIRQLVYSRVIYPCSKKKSVEKVFPSLFEHEEISVDQVTDAINNIGMDYKKFIEIFNEQIKKVYGRKTDTVYFDCTNYYFEIDLPKDDKQKGVSKENRNEPIIGQALLLDSHQIPIAMEMYPGNCSEKPYIRKLISEMKERYKIKGKSIQVADKGLNCAENIVTALKNGDGYVFSKSVHGKNLSDIEKKWVLLKNDYKDVLDNNGNVKYRIKECVDSFTYVIELEDGTKKKVMIKEKRVVSYNPDLARKQRLEILKQVDKASSLNTITEIKKSEHGDTVKFLKYHSTDKDGKKAKFEVELDINKINEELELAGYNLIVTSEIDKSPIEIYDIYHGLWRIEESFRITKSYLDARPVYLQKRESIYGHFLICYIALVLLRLLEFKVFDNQLSVSSISEFIKNFTVSEAPNDIYINNASLNSTFKFIKNYFKIDRLDNAYLSLKDIKKVISTKV